MSPYPNILHQICVRGKYGTYCREQLPPAEKIENQDVGFISRNIFELSETINKDFYYI